MVEGSRSKLAVCSHSSPEKVWFMRKLKDKRVLGDCFIWSHELVAVASPAESLSRLFSVYLDSDLGTVPKKLEITAASLSGLDSSASVQFASFVQAQMATRLQRTIACIQYMTFPRFIFHPLIKSGPAP